MVDTALADVAANLRDLEPVDLAQVTAHSSDRALDGLVDGGAGADDLHEAVGAVRHGGERSGPGAHPPDRTYGGQVLRRPDRTPAEVYTITEAQRGLSDEQGGRQRRYLVAMLVRTACVLGAIIVPGWPRWVLIAGAVILPYLAVVIANAGRENDEPGDVGVSAQPRLALPSRGRDAIG